MPSDFPPAIASWGSFLEFEDSTSPIATKLTRPEQLSQEPLLGEPSLLPQPFSPWRIQFFENDFSYKNFPDAPYFFGEEFKNVSFEEESPWIFSYGGELRHRYLREDNRLSPGLPGEQSFQQWRLRNYLNVEHEDWGRVYVEGQEGSTFGEELPFPEFDPDRWDILNAFADLYLYSDQDRSWVFRAGRQELLYGSQHLISPLDWENKRRRFEGIKLFTRGEDWDLDLFLTCPVDKSEGSLLSGRRLISEKNSTFSGAWFTYRGIEHQLVDLYWLWLFAQDPSATKADGNRHTLGARWVGYTPYLNASGKLSRSLELEFQGAVQLGKDNDVSGMNREVLAGFFTASATHNWVSLPWSPSLGTQFYWGSGDQDPNDGQNNTFAVMFPMGHAYWGLIDSLSGQNLIDYSVFAKVQPTKKLNAVAAWHAFRKATDEDFSYNMKGSSMGGFGFGSDIGTEFDIITTYTFSPNFQIQAGASWFFTGDAVSADPGLLREDATFFYLQSTFRY